MGSKREGDVDVDVFLVVVAAKYPRVDIVPTQCFHMVAQTILDHHSTIATWCGDRFAGAGEKCGSSDHRHPRKESENRAWCLYKPTEGHANPSPLSSRGSWTVDPFSFG